MKLGTIAQLLFIIVAAIAVFLFVRSARNDQLRTSCDALCLLSPQYAGQNRLAPDFELPDLEGKPVRLSSYRGKTVFLNFWTKTCGPCLQEMPSLAELARIAATRKDFAVLTVSTDEGPKEAIDALKVALDGPVPFPVLLDPEAKIVRERYGTRLYPETWIIDPKGIIRARFDGAQDWTAPLMLELSKMVQRPSGCPIEFFKGAPRGPLAKVCEGT